MKLLGSKDVFALEYSVLNIEEGILKLYVYGNSLCTYVNNNQIYEYRGNIKTLAGWFDRNLNTIIEEDKFPLDVEGTTGIELYDNSSDVELENEEDLFRWYELRQNWYFKHSWYSERGGSYLADLIFRRFNDEIEISWNNTHLYKGINFLNPSGAVYINKDIFIKTIKMFIDELN